METSLIHDLTIQKHHGLCWAEVHSTLIQTWDKEPLQPVWALPPPVGLRCTSLFCSSMCIVGQALGCYLFPVVGDRLICLQRKGYIQTIPVLAAGCKVWTMRDRCSLLKPILSVSLLCDEMHPSIQCLCEPYLSW